MASLKEVRNRINSVNSTQQITKAMKMVAAAKLRRAQDKMLQMRPYAEKLNGILSNVSATLENGADNQYGESREEVNNVLIIVVSSDRGLCGAFNTNVFKAANALISDQYQAQYDAGNVEVLSLGKKAKEYFGKREYNTKDDFFSVFSNLSFNEVKKAAEYAMEKFAEGAFDRVHVVYNEFKNVATQVVVAEQFLPVLPPENEGSETSTDYIFEPNKEYIVQDLIPTSLKVQLYKATLESNASEHGARMTAMDKATENAGDLLKELKLTYNRSRQAAITTEILEIVGGAEALAQGS